MRITKNILVIVFVVLTTLFSCSKQDSLNEESLNLINSFSSVAVFNAIPNSQSLTLSIHQGSTLMPVVTASDRLAYGNYVPYKNWFFGNFPITIENQTLLSRETIQRNISLASGSVYSLFLYKNGDIQILLSADNIIKPSEGKIKIRVAHLSEDLTAVNVKNNKSSADLFQNIKFQAISDFIEIDANVLASNFNINTADGKIELPMIGDVKIENRRIYTILIKGTLAAENIDFSIIKQ